MPQPSSLPISRELPRPDKAQAPLEFQRTGVADHKVASTSAAAVETQIESWRGKIRCDHCRANNLRCDRIQPTCNNCLPLDKACTYTPSAPNANRAMPRCDHCRAGDLKCDRKVPVCSECSRSNSNDCHYSPKKRASISDAHAVEKHERSPVIILPPLKSSMDKRPPAPAARLVSRPVASHPEHVEILPRPRPSSRPVSISCPAPSDGADSRTSPRANDGSGSNMRLRKRIRTFNLYVRNAVTSYFFFTICPITIGINPLNIQPWSNNSFASLPEEMCNTIRDIPLTDMPDRTAFDVHLHKFLAGVSVELRETACLSEETYLAMARGLAKGDLSKVSPHLRAWATVHHLCSVSDKNCLLLAPAEKNYSTDTPTAIAERLRYKKLPDDLGWWPVCITRREDAVNDINFRETGSVGCQRLPVRSQIFDILVYAHRGHGSASFMLSEIQGAHITSITWPMAELFIRQCPRCAPIKGRHTSVSVKP
ncbi:hypothetical protein FISHEDRAFT_39613 [Fistulina hepatica ATCC 64428]|uniref:Zn(2)-C6 fungal-type domain-containing protein n=1 Tax=Fistulina hepatica ATCC 64428 TaxID=1128425 RepID=A0A0D7AGA1_9AGAR|nr:hypothetical protein FISHEDRAFT_39613 [Fistulina hepatica ATCC 64428]